MFLSFSITNNATVIIDGSLIFIPVRVCAIIQCTGRYLPQLTVVLPLVMGALDRLPLIIAFFFLVTVTECLNKMGGTAPP